MIISSATSTQLRLSRIKRLLIILEQEFWSHAYHDSNVIHCYLLRIAKTICWYALFCSFQNHHTVAITALCKHSPADTIEYTEIIILEIVPDWIRNNPEFGIRNPESFNGRNDASSPSTDSGIDQMQRWWWQMTRRRKKRTQRLIWLKYLLRLQTSCWRTSDVNSKSFTTSAQLTHT